MEKRIGSVFMKDLICIVEDELHISQLVKYNVEAEGYRTICFENGEDMFKNISKETPSIFLLDLMLPGIDGMEICRLLRRNPLYLDIPIIILTAKSDELDKVVGLELGADDYITKPFSTRELLARIRAVLRRYTTNNDVALSENVYTHKNLKLDCIKHEVCKNSQSIEMTYKEFELLKYLMQNKGNVITREILLDKIWGYDYIGETRTVDVHVRYLRQKIEEDDSNPTYIQTVRGIGYRFSDK